MELNRRLISLNSLRYEVNFFLSFQGLYHSILSIVIAEIANS